MHSTTSRITAHGVSFELPNGRRLFEDLNLTLHAGITALTGPNGAGKSTLARLMAGDVNPMRGEIRRNVPISILPQREEAGHVSVAEFLGPDYTASETAEMLLGGIDRASPCARLSGGQWMRVRLARIAEAGFLILDEPTNDLDREGREVVLRFIRRHREGILLISHDRECLALCDETWELSNRGLTRYGGGWELYNEAREQERARLEQALRRAGKEQQRAEAERFERRERQEKRARQGARSAAKGGQAKILLGARKRAAEATTGKIDTDTQRKAAEAVYALRNAVDELKFDPVMYAELEGAPLHGQKRIVEAIDFNVRYDGASSWVYPRDLNLAWRGNARMALEGNNGSGKSTLVQAILGLLPASIETRGTLSVGPLKTLYLHQTGFGLAEDKSVFENIRDVSGASDTEIRNKLAGFLFTRESVFQPVRSLSVGERMRAALARGFFGDSVPELLVLDEPTNNLDLMNIAFLERIVAGFRGAVIVVSHDRAFVKNCGLQAYRPGS